MAHLRVQLKTQISGLGGRVVGGEARGWERHAGARKRIGRALLTGRSRAPGRGLPRWLDKFEAPAGCTPGPPPPPWHQRRSGRGFPATPRPRPPARQPLSPCARQLCTDEGRVRTHGSSW